MSAICSIICSEMRSRDEDCAVGPCPRRKPGRSAFRPPRPRGTGMATFCSIVRCGNEEEEIIVGTSTNWSAVCGARRTVRAARGGHTILGTSITYSATRKSRGARMSTNCSTICGANTWSNGTTSTGSTICSTVRCCTRACGSTSSNGCWPRGGRCGTVILPGVHLEVHRTCRLREGIFGNAAVYFNSRPPPCPGRPRSPVGRCGAETWPGLQLPSAARVATTSADGAASAAAQRSKRAAS